MVYVLLLVFGLCLGSFANAVVWRVHEQSRLKKPDADLSILKGRSMCPSCHHQLAVKDLIPLFSWLFLKGKCRYCHKPISAQYPIVEAVTASLFVLSYVWWPMPFDTHGTFNFVIWLIMLTGFMALTVYDLKWMILPNRLIFPLIALAAISIVINVLFFNEGLEGITGAIFAMLITAGIFYVLFQLSNGKVIGGGDVKLGILIGLLIKGASQGFLVLFIASLIGTLVILPGLTVKKLKFTSKIPFGPFLIIAVVIVRLFGTGIIQSYKTLFLQG